MGGQVVNNYSIGSVFFVRLELENPCRLQSLHNIRGMVHNFSQNGDHPKLQAYQRKVI